MQRIREDSQSVKQIKMNYNTHGKEAYNQFIEELVFKGAPLIEKVHDDQSLITFFYEGNDDCENVLLIPPVGMFNFEKNLMERFEDSNLWYSTYEIRNDVRFGYYFSPNDPLDSDWEKRYEGLVHDVFNPNQTFFKGLNGKNDRIRSNMKLEKACEHNLVNSDDLVKKGQLFKHVFKSEQLKEERLIRVYVPSGYELTEEKLDILLVTDGEEHLSILKADVVLDNLIHQKKIPNTIGIFVDSTDKRGEELRCNDKFSSFIADELLPWIQKRYRISELPEKATISGVSLGGLTAAYMGLTHPHIFGNVLSQSGSFWYKPEDSNSEFTCWISDQYKAKKEDGVKIYMNVGVLETKDRMIDTNEDLFKVLSDLEYDVTFEYFKSGHDYLSWGEYLGRGLISLANRRL